MVEIPFNVDPTKVQEHEYLNQTRSVPQAAANTTFGKAIGDIGELAAATGKYIDTGFKDYIKETTQDKAYKEREDYTSALRLLKAQTVSGEVPEGAKDPEGNPVANPRDILGYADEEKSSNPLAELPSKTINTSKVSDVFAQAEPTDKPPPPSVQDMRPSVENLESARANGTISETYYYQRLAAIAKDMRSRFPGYREYIDKQISEVTGVDPANAYVKSLIGDINSFRKLKDEADAKTDSYIQQNMQFEGMQNIARLWATRSITREQVLAYGAIFEQAKYKIDQEKARIELSKAQGGEATRLIELSASKIAQEVTNSYSEAMLKASGKTSEEIDKYFDDVANNRVALDPKLVNTYGQVLDMVGKKIETKIREKYSEPLKSENPAIDGKSLFDLLGPEMAEKKIQEALALNKSQKDRVANANFGMIGLDARVAKSVTDSDTIKIYSNPGVGIPFRLMSAIDKMAPSIQATQMKEIIAHQIPEIWKAFSVTLPGVLAALPEPVNTSDLLDHAKREAERKGETVPPAVTKNVVELPSKFVNDPQVSDIVKIRVAQNNYTARNASAVLDKFQKDTYDANGNWIPGYVDAYSRMFSPETTDNMRKLGAKNGAVWNNYRKAAEYTFGAKIFPTEIQDLNSILTSPQTYFDVKYSTENHSFSILVKDAATLGNIREQNQYYGRFQPYRSQAGEPPSSAELKQAQASITRLNQGIQIMAAIAEKSGMNIDEYIYTQLRNSGLNADTLPEMMKIAMEAHKKEEKK